MAVAARGRDPLPRLVALHPKQLPPRRLPPAAGIRRGASRLPCAAVRSGLVISAMDAVYVAYYLDLLLVAVALQCRPLAKKKELSEFFLFDLVSEFFPSIH